MVLLFVPLALLLIQDQRRLAHFPLLPECLVESRNMMRAKGLNRFPARIQVSHLAASGFLCVGSNLKKYEASGSQLAERLEQLLTELGQGAQVQADPVSAAEQAMRSMHLDPLVEAGVCLRRKRNLWMPGTVCLNL